MKKLIQTFGFALFFSCAALSFGQPSSIPVDFFGVNGWMNQRLGNSTNMYDCPGLAQTYSNSPTNCYLNGQFDANILTNCPGKITNLYAKLIRYGGSANDLNPPNWDQYITEIDRIRSLGSEPIIQIPWSYSSTQAGDLLTFINSTCGRKVKYFSIGNEPDMYSSYPSSSPQVKADFIAATYTTVVPALKVIDNTIKIIGPSFASYDKDVYKILLTYTATSSIAGADGSGNYYLDIADFHYYPFHGDDDVNHTLPNIQASPEGSLKTALTHTVGGANDGIVDLITSANSSRSSSFPLKFSISEMNVDWKNPSSNGATGLGASGFVAGQWMAECYSVILEQGKNTGSSTSKVAFASPWSFYESGGNSSLYDLGIVSTVSATCSPSANVERSTYWHMQMMGQYFSGTYYKGTNNVTTAVKQFGSYLANGGYALMILNEESSTSYSTCVISTGTVATGGALNIHMDMPGTTHTYTISSGIAAQETQLLIMDCNWNLVKHFKYTSGNATITTYSTGTGVAPLSLSVTSTSTDCNSSNGSATVTPTGGTGTYTYSWSNGSTTASASSLGGGTYTVTVNTQTCTAGVSAVVTIGKKSPTLSLSSANGNSCSGSSGTFTVTPSGGTSPYTYTWSPGSTNTSTVSIPNPGNNAASTYTMKVTDAHGCANAAVVTHYGTHTISITPPASPSVGTCCGVTLTATYIPGATYT